MKIGIFVCAIFLFFVAPLSRADSLYVGPIFGGTSYTDATGQMGRQSQTSYGLENFVIHDHWSVGLSYIYFAPGEDGTDSINVDQSDHWLSVQGRYRFWNEDFSPYVSVGAGGIYQFVSTTVMNYTERTNGLFFINDFGIGLMGRISGQFGANVSAKYYQFSNVNGFDYYISIGFFPDL